MTAYTADASLSGTASFAAAADRYALKLLAGTAQRAAFQGGNGSIEGPPTVVLVILDDTIDKAPGPIRVSVTGANAGALLTFTVNTETVWNDVADVNGELTAATIDLPLDLMAGTYSMVVTTTDNGSDSVSFTLLYDPDPLPPTLPSDTGPATVPDSVGHWVFQDLMDGGLGSWVLPVNPTTMTNPHFERTVTTKHTTSASQGQFTVGEAVFAGRPWRITGYYPDQTFYNQLQQFADLRRRFYVHDHRGRVWKVGVQDLSTTPRNRQSDAVSSDNDWAGSYDLTFVLYSQTPIEVP